MFKESSYIKAAERLNCEICAIIAVSKVESAGAAYDKDGKVKILFESHLFYRNLQSAKIDTSKVDPSICQPRWNQACREQYNNSQNKRLALAIKVNEEAAYRSISMGAFQILGSHYKALGYKSAKDMYKAYENDLEIMLDDFVDFCIANNLDGYLRDKRWSSFAKGYNGPSFKLNQYDTKIETAYRNCKQ